MPARLPDRQVHRGRTLAVTEPIFDFDLRQAGQRGVRRKRRAGDKDTHDPAGLHWARRHVADNHLERLAQGAVVAERSDSEARVTELRRGRVLPIRMRDKIQGAGARGAETEAARQYEEIT
jgi:hypothetical protein